MRYHRLLARSLGTPASSARSPAAEKILLFFLLLAIVRLRHNGVRVALLVVVYVLGAVPQTVAVILVDRPATILVLVLVVGPLSAPEAAEIVPVVIVRKTQRPH